MERKLGLLAAASCSMNSSKELCMEDAKALAARGNLDAANARLEKAAQYAWGFSRPANW